ncbi:hypothetical protein [Ottowia thiooxydans]|uniref:Uncharacterized protein n=1 Tax=Ottowia thiooxydans TaxID=219182 RepID=A0ABV2QIF1_9BURK
MAMTVELKNREMTTATVSQSLTPKHQPRSAAVAYPLEVTLLAISSLQRALDHQAQGPPC